MMTHNFNTTPKAEIPRSSFDLSSGYKTTFDAGYLIPFFVEEALPGDTFNLQTSIFARFATALHPFMDNVRLTTFYFAVPMRLVWDNTQKFFGEQRNPGDSTDFLIPQMTAPVGGYAASTIYDYMELPVGIAGFTHSALPLRAYNLIYNEWFRDQNLQNSVTVLTDDGPDPVATYQILRRGKRHDYFTSSLPWPQKGAAVSIPLGTTAPITGIGMIGSGIAAPAQTNVRETGTVTENWAFGGGAALAAPNGMVFQTDGASSGTQRPLIFADLSAATGSTINQLRQAFAYQKLLERDARGGTRYTEILRAHFNVVSPDARLQRPEYLGGGSTPLNLYQVPQTNDGGSTPQANLAAYGTAAGSNNGFTKSFTEHTIVIGILSVQADLNYQQGTRRMWSRRTKYDFYWPALAHIGEQAVLMKEIYTTGTAADADAWGYQERYGEYRYRPSMVTAEMRSSFAQSLDTWHLAQDFAVAPALNAAFIEDNPPIDRVIAVTSEPHFIMDCFHKFRAARPMPVYGVPGFIDRF